MWDLRSDLWCGICSCLVCWWVICRFCGCLRVSSIVAVPSSLGMSSKAVVLHSISIHYPLSQHVTYFLFLILLMFWVRYQRSTDRQTDRHSWQLVLGSFQKSTRKEYGMWRSGRQSPKEIKLALILWNIYLYVCVSACARVSLSNLWFSTTKASRKDFVRVFLSGTTQQYNQIKQTTWHCPLHCATGTHTLTVRNKNYFINILC